MSGESAFHAVDAEVRQLALRLSGADQVTVAVQSARLRHQAEQIQDALWRRRAIARVEGLPAMAAGPRGGTSPEFRVAERLVARGISLQGRAPERLSELRRLSDEIAVLAGHAPVREASAVRRMNNTLNRLIAELEAADGI
ncbi:hypothetical protein AB0F43_32380 [Kribbella sp. NPDC023972]|uniref:hypothetical protein n=1 Tax=Kribbella sp. NPDC023972 TaxID=3154795 RepID=UPI0033F62CC2